MVTLRPRVPPSARVAPMVTVHSGCATGSFGRSNVVTAARRSAAVGPRWTQRSRGDVAIVVGEAGAAPSRFCWKALETWSASSLFGAFPFSFSPLSLPTV